MELQASFSNRNIQYSNFSPLIMKLKKKKKSKTRDTRTSTYLEVDSYLIII